MRIVAIPQTRRLLLIAVAVLATGCGGGGAPTTSTPTQTPAPTVAVSLSSAKVRVGEAVTLTWSSSNATSCTGADSLSGNQATSGTSTITPTAGGQFKYTINCTGSGGSGTQSATLIVPLPILASSYLNYKQIGLAPQSLPAGDNTMRAYGNFTDSGRLDLFRAVITYDASKPQSSATPSRFEFWAKQSDGSFTLSTTLLAKSDGCLHPRKPIVADFNGDGRPDVFVACHGYDANPFPGERNKVVLSQSDGSYQISDASSDVGFWHGASAADLNGDGKIDVVLVNNFDPDRALAMINDGAGHFIRETTSRMPRSMRNHGGFFSVELVDVDEDGKLDLIVGGHEFENAPTAIFVNPGNNDFSSVSPTIVPAVPNEGVVLDFTVTGTRASRTLWLVRTSGGDGTFYQSRTVQKVSYPGMASSVVLQKRPATWIPWLIPATVNGVPVVASDNAKDGVSIPQ